MGETPRIIVIDGDKTIRRSIAALLEAEGMIVETAETGMEAIAKSNMNFYNLALINIRLSDMTGTDILPRMKETVPPMIKVMLSGYATVQKAIDAVNNGADACILIPTNPEKILTTVNRCLKKQELNKRYSEQKVSEFIETRVRELGY